jgi:hypothetical protein
VELRGSIRSAIPRLIDLLKYHYQDVHLAAASALARLAEHGKSQRGLVEMLLTRI